MAAQADLLRIRSALAGDANATAELVRALVPVIRHRVARALLRVHGRTAPDLRAEVADFTQDVLLSLFADKGKQLRAWEPERGLSLENFVGLLAQRQVVTILRSRRKSPFSTEPTDPVDFEQQVDLSAPRDVHVSVETKQWLELLALNLQARLSPLGLQMFQLLFVEENSVEVVSHKTGLSAESIYQWRSRIKKAALEVQNELTLEPT